MFPQVRPHSSPEDSDTPAEFSDQLYNTCASPEGVLAPYDEEEKQEEAREHRM